MVIALIALLAFQQPVDSAYTAKIRELTTEPRFNTELTDHLPTGLCPGYRRPALLRRRRHTLLPRARRGVPAREGIRPRQER